MTFDLNRKSQFKMKRSMIESAIDKSLKDIEINPFRGTRNLVDIGLHFSSSRFQKNLFKIIHDVLNNVESPYYELVSRTVLNTERETLKQFGANIGYNSWTYGASLIRAREGKTGIEIPWTILYDLPEKMVRLDYKIISNYICEGEKMGIYTSMIFPEMLSNQYEEIFQIALKYKNSGFIIFEQFQNISTASLNKLKSLNNTMIVPIINNEYRKSQWNNEVFNTMQLNKMLYGVGLLYNDTNYLDITSNECMKSMENFKAPLVFFIAERNKNSSEKAKKHIGQIKSAYRNAIKYSYFVIDLFSDINEIDHIISGNTSFLEINGTSYYKKSPFEKEKMSIYEDTTIEKIIFHQSHL